MKPVSFEYFSPSTVKEVISLLKQHGPDAKVLAGGQSLVPLMNMRLARPRYIVDINKVSGLDYIREADGGLAIGALTRHRSVERSDLVKRRCPLLYEAIPFIGHPPIRNRGTFGGSLSHADPAAELPAVMLALGAEMKAQGLDGERTIKARDFFVSYLKTALKPTELLTEVKIPPWPANTGWSFMEVAPRHGDLALVGVAVMLTLKGGRCQAANIALTGVGGTPLKAKGAEEVLVGQAPADKLFKQAAQKVSEEIEPTGDIHASAEYRKHVAGVLTRRALQAAQEAVRGKV